MNNQKRRLRNKLKLKLNLMPSFIDSSLKEYFNFKEARKQFIKPFTLSRTQFGAENRVAKPDFSWKQFLSEASSERPLRTALEMRTPMISRLSNLSKQRVLMIAGNNGACTAIEANIDFPFVHTDFRCISGSSVQRPLSMFKRVNSQGRTGLRSFNYKAKSLCLKDMMTSIKFKRFSDKCP